MARWKILVLMLAVALFGTFALTGAATAGPRDASTFTLVGENSSFRALDHGDFTFTDRLETLDGIPIDGTGNGKCANLSLDAEAIDSYMCTYILDLPEGLISSSFMLDYTELVGDWELDIAIDGGTGAFRNARGEMILTPHPENPDLSFLHVCMIGASASY